MTAAIARRGNAPGRHVYDVIVVGGQLGGAIAAALCAKRGLQVLHVPHDGLSSPYTHQDFKFVHAPFLLPPIKSVPVFDEALQELGLASAVSRAMSVTPLQLLENDRWFELSHDEKRRGPELDRALGPDAEAFDELLRKAQSAADASDSFFQTGPDLPPDGFFARWKFKRTLPRFPGLELDTPLPSDGLLRKLTPFISGVLDPAALTKARVLGRTLAGPVVFKGGREALWQLLAERARELGADVLDPEVVIDRLVLEGSTTGLRLTRSDTVYRAGALIAAMDLEVLTRIIPEKQRKAATKLLPAVVTQKACVTFHCVLPERALPRGLGALAIVDAPTLDGGLVLLSIGTGANPDQRVMSATVQAPIALRAGGEPAVRALAAQVHTALARVMPFTKAHVTLESTPWLDAPHVVDGRAEVQPLFQLAPAAWLGVSGHLTKGPWSRVTLASRQVLPGLGFEGEVMAAQRAVKAVELSLKKNDPLKRKTA